MWSVSSIELPEPAWSLAGVQAHQLGGLQESALVHHSSVSDQRGLEGIYQREKRVKIIVYRFSIGLETFLPGDLLQTETSGFICSVFCYARQQCACHFGMCQQYTAQLIKRLPYHSSICKLYYMQCISHAPVSLSVSQNKRYNYTRIRVGLSRRLWTPVLFPPETILMNPLERILQLVCKVGLTRTCGPTTSQVK